MSNIRDLGTKINSLNNMQKVMKAMNMIASIKLRKLFYLKDSLALFNSTVDEIGKQINHVNIDHNSPYIAGYKSVKLSHIIVFTADKGLCGTHNSSILKTLDTFVKANKEIEIETEITCIGNKGMNYCKRNEYLLYQHSEINERVFNVEQLQSMAKKIIDRYTENNIQKLYVLSNIFYSTLDQRPLLQQLLPLDFAEKEKNESVVPNFIIEPESEQFLHSAINLYVFYKLKSFLFNSYLSEHSSRMTAMENATQNSEDLINKYVSMQNHVRQATITNELIEIVSGKEALKG
jgi:F-type H+-transporting ATPase subunit gamma